MAYILPAVTLVLLAAGLVVQKRNRSPYGTGLPTDAQSLTNYRRGEALTFLGSVCFLVELFIVGR